MTTKLFLLATLGMSKMRVDLAPEQVKSFSNFNGTVFQEDLSTLTNIIHTINNWNPKLK